MTKQPKLQKHAVLYYTNFQLNCDPEVSLVNYDVNSLNAKIAALKLAQVKI
jgi:hypothetical protein